MALEDGKGLEDFTMKPQEADSPGIHATQMPLARNRHTKMKGLASGYLRAIYQYGTSRGGGH
jgi:hypothetical protein